ncbi:zinc finger, AN1 type domain 2B, isoform CRA_c [Rattus norvegicus]|uniref:Zinc finger, AN1 type domain 2B, isoform CRA_c n=1 Tax=Rattus norvegicus TaxID=10116 RepID=A6JVY5_RAT|nr:zinc finger, AN1 type domain 2B, isoform CRA_c [Rattus norvegicus]
MFHGAWRGRKLVQKRVAEKRSLVGALVGANQTQSPQPLTSYYPTFPRGCHM